MTVRAPTNRFSAALEAVVAAIAALGYGVTRDPGDFQAPGVLVAPPTITGAATLGAYGMTIPIWIVATDTRPPSLDWMLEAVDAILAALGESGAEPTSWNAPVNPAGLPAYLITARAQVTEG